MDTKLALMLWFFRNKFGETATEGLQLHSNCVNGNRLGDSCEKLDVGEKNADLNASRFAPAGRESELVPNVIVLLVAALDDAGCLVRGLQLRSSAVARTMAE